MSDVAIVSLLVTGSFLAVMGAIWLLRQVNWRRRLTSPVVVSAVVAGITAFAVAAVSSAGGLVSGWISAANQKSAEIEKTKANILLGIVQQYDSSMVGARNGANRRER